MHGGGKMVLFFIACNYCKCISAQITITDLLNTTMNPHINESI